MRTESNHARGTFRQLRIALLGGLTYRLLSLSYQIEFIKSDLEVCTPGQCRRLSSHHRDLTVPQLEVDKQRLDTESGASAPVPGPADSKFISRTYSWIFIDHRSLSYCHRHELEEQEQCDPSATSHRGHPSDH
jgi:hypothetical protein